MRPYRILIAALLLPSALAGRAPAMTQEMTVTQSVYDKIAAFVAAEDAAWNKGDAEAFAARALPDVVFTNVVGMFSVGKAPFVEQHRRIFSTIYKGSINRQQVQHITLLKPDIEIVNTLSVVTGAPHLPPGVELVDGAIHARLEQVLVRRTDGWWIASFHNVAVHPAVASQAPGRP